MEMRQQPVPLHRGHGQPGFAHIVKHLGEDTKIIGRCAEAVDLRRAPGTDQREEAQSHHRRQHRIDPAFLAGLSHRLRGGIPAQNAEHRQAGSGQRADRQKRHGKGRLQRQSCQDEKDGRQSPSLRPGPVHEAGDAIQHRRFQAGEQEDPAQRHLRQAIQLRQIPGRPRQTSIFDQHRKQPGYQHLPDQCRCLHPAKVFHHRHPIPSWITYKTYRHYTISAPDCKAAAPAPQKIPLLSEQDFLHWGFLYYEEKQDMVYGFSGCTKRSISVAKCTISFRTFSGV